MPALRKWKNEELCQSGFVCCLFFLFVCLTPPCSVSKVGAHWTDTKSANIPSLGRPKGAARGESTAHPFTSRTAKDSRPRHTVKNSLSRFLMRLNNARIQDEREDIAGSAAGVAPQKQPGCSEGQGHKHRFLVPWRLSKPRPISWHRIRLHSELSPSRLTELKGTKSPNAENTISQPMKATEGRRLNFDSLTLWEGAKSKVPATSRHS